MKAKTAIKLLVLLALVFLVLPPALLAAHGDKKPMKKGILLVAFGTTVPEAQISYDNIERSVKKTFPGVPVRWGYTSRTIIRKMAEKGKHLATPEEALSSMMRENFTHVAVQSLHVMPGAEFHGLVKNVQRFAGMSKGLQKVIVGYPLMTTSEDVQRVAETLLKIIPPERRKTDAVVFMGHGTHHPANVYYAALNYHVQKLDPNVFVGTVEGWPEIDDITSDLKNNRIEKAYLMPFMTVAGDHARNDMAGPSADSWKSMLEKEGVNCLVVLKGTAEFQEFVDIWVDHLRAAFEHFQ
ncbi:MAG: sirohydrochlorin cobaltochelatase [Deltaproteobacteria bacterium]|jgi:sirohydrochlorin cobaltochelatase|nr:sirohydrochlorin cobaltochelatase [Deltaproteobacteria bacterium]MDH3852148.1 sirohydrochlorin cobaltochelatase [Deltaproteobacteria bacterium]MDH3897914.1 sirohydrochlorin cobaltochelatase [Deltaproteobacteria bacterium]MDH3927204.1 sirohydrochlorin cobaltochelatase [Deltaproteobacteria bacterium]MDH3952096.1 sirohydrochlorin cobaltochelatase [Deltaproteobacteria bacterium]